MGTQVNDSLAMAVVLYQGQKRDLKVTDWTADETDSDVVRIVSVRVDGAKVLSRVLYDKKNHQITILEEKQQEPEKENTPDVGEKAKKTVVLYQAQNPYAKVIEWHVDKDNPDLVHILVERPSKTRVVASVTYDDLVKGASPVRDNKKENHSGRIVGFLAMFLTVAYAIYIVFYFSGVGMESLGGYIAMSMVSPHMICAVAAACFSLVGFCARKRWSMLVSGILMAVSIAMFPTYAKMVIVQTILLFIACARMKA